MSNVSAKIKEEIDALIPPMIFFFIALNIVALIRALMLKGTGIAPSTPLAIALAALILAKAVLLADLHARHQPLSGETADLQRAVEDADLFA